MAPDKHWMNIKNRASKEYVEGVDTFLNWAFSFPKGENRIRCPCNRCKNTIFLVRVQVRFHLFKNGFNNNYTFWSHHGERAEDLIMETNLTQEEHNENDDDLRNLICDAYSHVNTEVGHTKLPIEFQQNDLEQLPTREAAKFYSLLDDAKQKLYPGYDESLTKFSFIVKLLHQKCMNKWTDKSMGSLLEHHKETLPEGALVPDSYYDAKKIIKKLGLDYVKIDACLNDCILYRKEHENAQECPVCGLSRWKSDGNESNRNATTNRKHKKVPHKVLRYFPITQRLQRLYMSTKTAKDMRWHKEENVDDGLLKHPADSLAWKSFDKKYPTFALDPRSVRFGLASDGFNPL